MNMSIMSVHTSNIDPVYDMCHLQYVVLDLSNIDIRSYSYRIEDLVTTNKG